MISVLSDALENNQNNLVKLFTAENESFVDLLQDVMQWTILMNTSWPILILPCFVGYDVDLPKEAWWQGFSFMCDDMMSTIVGDLMPEFFGIKEDFSLERMEISAIATFQNWKENSVLLVNQAFLLFCGNDQKCSRRSHLAKNIVEQLRQAQAQESEEEDNDIQIISAPAIYESEIISSDGENERTDEEPPQKKRKLNSGKQLQTS